MRFFYTPSFLRQFKGLENALKEEVREKIGLFQSDMQHPSLRVHKLKGKLKGQYSFSVNYYYRIVFCYDTPEEIAFLDVGDHDVYR